MSEKKNSGLQDFFKGLKGKLCQKLILQLAGM